MTATPDPLREGLEALASELGRDRQGLGTNSYNMGYNDGHHDARIEVGHKIRALLAETGPAAEECACPTAGCNGDGRYAAPGRGHIEGCRHPLGDLTIPPAPHGDDTGAVEVTERMLERAWAAWNTTPHRGFDVFRDDAMRAALTAALTPEES